MKIKAKEIKPIHDHVIAVDMTFEERTTTGGIVIPGLDGKLEGIHPRWACVYAVGPEQQDVVPGQYILVEHGRWSRGHTITLDTGKEITIRRVDPPGIMLVSDQAQSDETIGQGM